jgi:hypothetical protein
VPNVPKKIGRGPINVAPSPKKKKRNEMCERPMNSYESHFLLGFVSLAYQGKDIVFRFSIEVSSLRDFGP